MNHTLNPRNPNPAVLIAFVFLGKYLEALAMGRTSAALSKLLNLQPQVRLLITVFHQRGSAVLPKPCHYQDYDRPMLHPAESHSRLPKCVM